MNDIEEHDRAVTVGIAIPLSVLKRLDKTRGTIPRSRLIVDLVKLYVGSGESQLLDEFERLRNKLEEVPLESG